MQQRKEKLTSNKMIKFSNRLNRDISKIACIRGSKSKSFAKSFKYLEEWARSIALFRSGNKLNTLSAALLTLKVNIKLRKSET